VAPAVELADPTKQKDVASSQDISTGREKFFFVLRQRLLFRTPAQRGDD